MALARPRATGPRSGNRLTESLPRAMGISPKAFFLRRRNRSFSISLTHVYVKKKKRKRKELHKIMHLHMALIVGLNRITGVWMDGPWRTQAIPGLDLSPGWFQISLDLSFYFQIFLRWYDGPK